MYALPGESPYEGKSYAELKDEIDSRNASRPEDQQIPCRPVEGRRSGGADGRRRRLTRRTP
jgi:hypothetical protein